MYIGGENNDPPFPFLIGLHVLETKSPLQQEHVISELKEYVSSTPTPPYAANVALTIEYLEACNQLFERGILGHVRIWSGDSVILQNMEKGYKFFSSWLDGLLTEGTVEYYD